MPPHLHPRSAATSTLFAGTLLASFIVVGIPHVFPCPRPRKTYADSPRAQLDENGQPVSGKSKPELQKEQLQLPGSKAPERASQAQSRDMEEEAVLFQQLKEEAELLEKQARECPVPKPTGWIGRALGFEKPHTPLNAESKPASSGQG